MTGFNRRKIFWVTFLVLLIGTGIMSAVAHRSMYQGMAHEFDQQAKRAWMQANGGGSYDALVEKVQEPCMRYHLGKFGGNAAVMPEKGSALYMAAHSMCYELEPSVIDPVTGKEVTASIGKVPFEFMKRQGLAVIFIPLGLSFVLAFLLVIGIPGTLRTFWRWIRK